MAPIAHLPPSPAASTEGVAPFETTASASRRELPADSGEVVRHYATHHPSPSYHASVPGGGFAAYRYPCGYASQEDLVPLVVGYPGPDEPSGGLYGVASAQAYYPGFAHPPFTPERSPPAPPPAEVGIRARSTARKRCSSGPPRRATRARTSERKPKPSKKVAAAIPLKGPMSQLRNVQSVFDVEGYVNRPVSVRKQELAGKEVKRPLNAFVLYRKAYGSVAKQIFMARENQNNQQLVSQICGRSWHMETEEVVNRFVRLAEIERIMHAKAFPDYKYTPRPGKKQLPKDASGEPEQAGSGQAGAGQAESGQAVSGGSAASQGCLTNEPGQPDLGSCSGAAVPDSLVYGQQGLPHQGHPYWPSPDMEAFIAPYWQGAQLPYHGCYSAYPMPGFGYGEDPPAAHYATHSLPPPPPPPPMELPVDAVHPGEPPGGLPMQFCIDPNLLHTAGELPARDNVLDGLHGPPPPPPPPTAVGATRGDMMIPMPDWGLDGEHNAYLRGGLGDWQVEPLEDIHEHFNDWMPSERATSEARSEQSQGDGV